MASKEQIMCKATLLFSVSLSAVISGGCCSVFPPCSVNETIVSVDEAASPTVPDQMIDGCFSALIERSFNNESERLLILRAEAIPSTIGPHWYSETKSTTLLYFLPDAVTGEAIAFYGKRIRAFQLGEDQSACLARLSFSAHIVPENEASFDVVAGHWVVRLELRYVESRGSLASSQLFTWREVEFDEQGEIVAVRGDGETVQLVS